MVEQKKILRTYSELITFPTFRERYEYLRIKGKVGEDTFGFDRWLNQRFYRSAEWKRIRNQVIVRDNACDLAADGYEIFDKIIIHHMNPISMVDLVGASDYLIDPEFLICTKLETHNAIHYGDSNLIESEVVERRPNDTVPWKK